MGGDWWAMDEARVVLGIDPGLAVTGYAILRFPGGRQRDAGPRVVEAGIIRTAPGQDLARRLDDIYRGVAGILDQHPVDWVAVEDLYTNYRHPPTALLMAHARGVVLLAAAQAGTPVESFPPARVKQALTGRGDAGKAQVQHMVQNYLGLRELPRPDHVADAMAVALAWGHLGPLTAGLRGKRT